MTTEETAMRPEYYQDNVRPDGTASYLEINPETPPQSSRDLGWDGVVVERDHFYPFDNGEVVYDEHFIGIITSPFARMRNKSGDGVFEGVCCEGDLILGPADHPLHWRLDDETEAVAVAIRPECLERVILEVTGTDPDKVRLLARSRERDPVILNLVAMLMSEAEGGGIGGRLYVESLTNALIVHLLRRHSTLGSRPPSPPGGGLSGPRLRRAIEAIRDNLEVGIWLSEVAEAAGVSPSHLSALFKRSTGMAPHQYLVRCRVERARELLRFGGRGLTLAQVAALSGFCDQSHLTRHFKRLVGITPAAYRERT
jgi:AraC family transcriptional regulator